MPAQAIRSRSLRVVRTREPWPKHVLAVGIWRNAQAQPLVILKARTPRDIARWALQETRRCLIRQPFCLVMHDELPARLRSR